MCLFLVIQYVGGHFVFFAVVYWLFILILCLFIVICDHFECLCSHLNDYLKRNTFIVFRQ